MHGACTVELSLYGGLWVWGDQRSTPWSTEEVPRHGRGELIVSGGTSELARGVARAVGGRVSLRTRAHRVTEESAGYSVEIEDETGRRMLRARHVICALPAPLAIGVLAELPGWKRAALRAVPYGRWISTPIVISPRGAPATRYPLVASRQTVSYNVDHFMGRTPGDVDELGGCFHSFMTNTAGRQVWGDSDESIKSDAVRALLARFPEYQDRIVRVDIQRWEHALPQYGRGLMRHFPALAGASGEHLLLWRLHVAGEHGRRHTKRPASCHAGAKDDDPGGLTCRRVHWRRDHQAVKRVGRCQFVAIAMGARGFSRALEGLRRTSGHPVAPR
jgi:protoporphyrinogen oxidase